MNLQSSVKVGKYSVDIDNIDKYAVNSITPIDKIKVTIIDEIGKMEC